MKIIGFEPIDGALKDDGLSDTSRVKAPQSDAGLTRVMTPDQVAASKPRIQNPDGSFSTERTISIEADGRHYNIPTIVNGRQLKPDDAIAAWERGENKETGVFKSAQEAEAAARKRSSDIGNADQQTKRPRLISFEPIDDPFITEFEGSPKDGERGIGGDTAKLAGQGVAGIAQGINEIGKAGQRSTEALTPTLWPARIMRDALLKAIPDSLKDYATGKAAEREVSKWKESLQTDMTPEMQAAQKKKWWDDSTDTLGPAWTDWRSYYSGLVASAPAEVLTMYPAMRLAKGVYAAQIAKGVLKEKAAAQAAAAAATAGRVGEAIVQGGQGGDSVREEIDKLPDDVLKQSEAVQQLLHSGLSMAQAREQITNDAATRAIVLSGSAAAIFGGAGDKVLAKAITSGLRGNIGSRALKGAVAEGALEEFPQEFGGAVGENISIQMADPKRKPFADALNRGLGGAVIGSIQGGALNAGLGSKQEAQNGRPVAADEVLGALDEFEKNHPANAPEGVPADEAMGAPANAKPQEQASVASQAEAPPATSPDTALEASTEPRAQGVWTVNGVDQPVTLNRYVGTQNGEDYFAVDGSGTAVPRSQLNINDDVLSELKRDGIIGEIERLAAEGRTSIEIDQALGGSLADHGDGPARRDYIRNVRRDLGIPTPDQPQFATWQAAYNARKAPVVESFDPLQREAEQQAPIAEQVAQAAEQAAPKEAAKPPRMTRAQYQQRQRTVLPDDSLFTAIAKLGGINRSELVSSWGVDPATVKGLSPVFGKPVARATGGHSIDGMAEMLVQHGYLDARDLREFEEKFDRELRGAPVFTSQGQDRAMGDEMQRRAEIEAEQADDAMLEQADFELTPEELDEIGYNSFSEAEQEAATELVQQLRERFAGTDAAGAVEDIIERAEEQTREQSATAFHDAIVRNLKDYINGAQDSGQQSAQGRSRADSRPGEADVAQAGPEGTGGEAASQEQQAEVKSEPAQPALELESPTPEKLRLKDEVRKLREQTEARKQAAPTPEEFILSGSDRPADEAAARGQQELAPAPESSSINDEVRRLKAKSSEPKAQTGLKSEIQKLKAHGKPIERFAGMYGKGMTKFNAEREQKRLAKEKPNLDWRVQQDPEHGPDRYEVVGYRKAVEVAPTVVDASSVGNKNVTVHEAAAEEAKRIATIEADDTERATDGARNQKTRVRTARDEGNAGVPDLAADSPQVPRSRTPGLSEVRGAGDQGLPGVADKLSGFFPGNGASPDAAALDRPDQERKGVQPGQLPVGGQEPAGAESPVRASGNDPQQDANDRRMGEGGGASSADAVQPLPAGADRRGNATAARGKTEKRGDADFQRRDAKRGGVGETARRQAQDDQGAPAQRMDSGNGAYAGSAEVANDNLADPNPSPAQVAANNYKHKHIRISGLDISIENAAGSERSGTDANGKKWTSKIHYDYGYIRGTESKDGDHLDVFVNVGTPEDFDGTVFVVDQNKANGHFDEHKAMVGFDSSDEARDAYLKNYQKGWESRIRAITAMPMAEFKAWLKEGDTLKPAQETEDKKPAAIISDVGEKVGGARKDLAVSTGRKVKAEESAEPAWRKRFAVAQIAKSGNPTEEGKWTLRDTKKTDWTGQARQIGSTFATKEEAEAAIPLAAVALKHRVVPAREGGKFEIWRDVTDRKRIKIVDQVFDSPDDAMRYMAKHAEEILDTKTSFGEEILPRPETVLRKGAERRKGDVKGEDFLREFSLRGVEFGNWNNQEERQQVMNHAFDALMDMADVLNLPPKALGLGGELALAFGARGHGLSGARAHYERNYGVINLTKMSGAGTLGHEWFHALDHYFGRQDGKAGSERVKNERGDMVFPAKGRDDDFVSHGFRMKSDVRPEVREAYTALIRTMFQKAETYVEDSKKAEAFVGRARDDLRESLDALRRDLAEQKDTRYYKRHNAPASAEQLAEFDGIAEKFLNGEFLHVDWRSLGNPTRGKLASGRMTNDALEQISAIYKAVRGRTGFDSTKQSGVLDDVRGRMKRFSERLKMLSDAQAGSEKSKKVPTSFAMEAKSIDQGRASAYWMTEHEMAARAFQAYIEDRIGDQGGRSDFLSYGTNTAVPTPWGWKRPFPAGEERVAIDAAFDHFFQTIKTEERDGHVTIFSRAEPEPGIARRDAEATVSLARLNLPFAPDTIVLDDYAQAPRELREQIEAEGGAVDGAFHNGKVYLFSSAIPNVDRAEWIIAHEYTHDGLRRLMGGELDAVLMGIHHANIDVQFKVAAMRNKFPHLSIVEATDEVLANIGGDIQAGLRKRPTWWKQVTAAIRDFLRRVGFVRTFTDDDVVSLVVSAQRTLKRDPRRRTHLYRNETAFHRAFHGTPHDFDRFDLDKIGSGEGAQAYGHGLYFAGRREVAEWYRDNLSKRNSAIKFRPSFFGKTIDLYRSGRSTYEGIRTAFPQYADDNDMMAAIHAALVYAASDGSVAQALSNLRADTWLAQHPEAGLRRLHRNQVDFLEKHGSKLKFERTKGRVFDVELAPNESDYLAWDKPLSEQSENVREALKGLGEITNRTGQNMLEMDASGEELYKAIGHNFAVSADLGRGAAWESAAKDIDATTSSDAVASRLLNSVGIPGIRYLDGSSRHRPLRDIKREFLAELPEEADANEVMDLLGTGKFSPANEAILKALHADEWLGFDFPAQALSAALGGELSRFDASPALVKAVAAAQGGSTYNYVIFDDSLVTVQAKFNIGADNASATLPGNESPDATQAEIDALSKRISGFAGQNYPAGVLEPASLPAGVQRIAGAFGVRAVGFRATPAAPPSPNGIFLGRTLYLNEKTGRPHLAVVGHELVHGMRRARPALFEEFKLAVRSYVQNYPDFYKRMRSIGYGADPQRAADEIREEFLAEIVSDGFLNESFWSALGEHSPSLLRRIYDFVRILAKRAKDAFSGYTPRTQKYLTDFDAVMRIAGKIMARYSDGMVIEPTANDVPAFDRTLSLAERVEAALSKKRGKTAPLEALTRAASNITGLTHLANTTYDTLLKLGAFVPEKFKAGVVSDYGIPEAVTDRRNLMYGRQREQLRQVQNQLDRLMNLTRAESRVAYEWMTRNDTVGDELLNQLPEDSRAVLQEIKQLVDKMGDEAVRLGQLSAEQRDRHKLAYLHRSYEKYDIEATPQQKASRARAIRILGDQYKGRGIVDAVQMSRIQNSAPGFWQRKLKEGKADVALKGQKFIRFEQRKNAGEGTEELFEGGKRPGRLMDVNYLPASEPVPAKYGDWVRDESLWEVRGTKADKLLMWRDFTATERERMGEIDEVRYAFAKTMQLMVHDLEAGRYLEWLANQHAKPEPQGKVVDATESMMAVFEPGSWVHVPTAAIAGTSVPKYGKLAGLYLPGPIWNDVRQVVNWRYQPLGETYNTALRAWKISKTALSPAVHMNNVMANVIMADWHDIRAEHLTKAMEIVLAAGVDPEKKGVGQATRRLLARMPADEARQILARFEDSGGAVGTYAMSELQREQLAPLIERLHEEVQAAQQGSALINASAALQALLQGRVRDAGAALSQSRSAAVLKKAGGAMIDLYQAEDVVFRVAAFVKAKGEGKSDLDAGKASRKSFLDYNINAPWIQAMRSTAFPFISFTYRALPMLIETIGRKPWKLAKLSLVIGALNALGYALSGGDEDKERKLLPEEKAGGVLGFIGKKLVRMPWNDENESPVFLDIRRFIPVGDIVDIDQTHSAIPILPSMQPGGPLVILGELVMNRSMFTGKEITKETDTATQKTQKVLDHLYKGAMPNLPMIPGTYSFTALARAGSGETDDFGRERNLGQAALSSIGIKIASYPPDQLRRNARAQRLGQEQEISENIGGLRRQLRRGGLTQEQFKKQMTDEIEKRKELRKETMERVQE